MPEQFVEAGSTARLGSVSGDLRVGRNATIMAESGKKVTVAGAANFEGPVTITCDLECGSMRVEGKGFGPGPAHGDVTVKGSLLVHGDLEIDASANIGGEITAEGVDVGGHLESRGISAKGVRVGGHMKTKGPLKAEDVDVGGHMSVDEQADIANLNVGGHAEIGGGTVKGNIRVRGHIKTSAPLTYGALQVYGHLTLPAGSSGERLNAFGKVEFEGDTHCEVMEVNGTARADGDCSAGSMKVNGRLDAKGVLKVSEKFEVFGSADATEVECGTLMVGGRLVAEKIDASGRAEIGGEVRAARGLTAKDVVVGTGSRIGGPVMAESVEVGKGPVTSAWTALASLHNLGRMTRVEDVYGKDVRIDRYSRAGRVFGETVRMQSGSMADEVIYTKEADISEGVHLEKPPRKVDRLPGPPS